MRAEIDEPTSELPVDPLCCFVRGWIWLEQAHQDVAAVEAWDGATLLGSTAVFYRRPDVLAALDLPATTRNGFELFLHHPGAPQDGHFPLQLRVRWQDGTRTTALAEKAVRTIGRDYRTGHFGVLLDQGTTAVQRRENVFATGPSSAEGSAEVAELLRTYLGPPPCRVVDVGCGLGSYGRTLRVDGYDWLGVEVDEADCAELRRLGLPHCQVDGGALPFADQAFDAALCIEVLEHIADPRAFVREIHRVAPRRLIVSVPNCELLGYLWDHLAAPWHMLESTHVNYFTRWSLRAVLQDYYPNVELRFHTRYPLPSVAGTPLYYHILAVATA